MARLKPGRSRESESCVPFVLMTSDRSYPVAPAPAERLKWDAPLAALSVLLFIQVWGVQSLFETLAVPGLLSVVTVVTLLLLALDRDPRRGVRGLNQPVVRAAVGLLLLATLSIPGSLDPGRSLEIVLQWYLRAVLLMLLVAGAVRGVADLQRLAWVQIAGFTLFCVVDSSLFWTGTNDKWL